MNGRAVRAVRRYARIMGMNYRHLKQCYSRTKGGTTRFWLKYHMRVRGNRELVKRIAEQKLHAAGLTQV